MLRGVTDERDGYFLLCSGIFLFHILCSIYASDVMNKSIVVRGPKGKMWGKVIDDVYETHRTEDHYCWKHRGYGIQLDVFGVLESRGVKRIKIITQKKRYEASLEDWAKHGIVDTLRKEDGTQIFMPLNRMDRDLPKGLKPLDAF